MKKVRSGASGGVFYLGLALIGVLAIPAAVLLGLIAGVWTLTDKLTALLEGDAKALLLRLIDAENEIGSTLLRATTRARQDGAPRERRDLYERLYRLRQLRVRLRRLPEPCFAAD